MLDADTSIVPPPTPTRRSYEYSQIYQQWIAKIEVEHLMQGHMIKVMYKRHISHGHFPPYK